MDKKKIIFTIMINYFPFLFLLGFVSLIYNFKVQLNTLWVYPAYIYLLPPFLCRLTSLFFKHNKTHFNDDDGFYFYWWFTVQLQVVFLRFPFLEELLRMVPTLYSNWLRLWGAKVGKNIYWSARVSILDRPFLEIGDLVVFGYGVNISSHSVKTINNKSELILSNIIIGSKAMLGGVSMMTTGARLGKGEFLPGKNYLLPFQEILNGKKSFRKDVSRKRPSEDVEEGLRNAPT